MNAPDAAGPADLARALLSPDRTVREDAERRLFAEPSSRLPALVEALQEGDDAPAGALGRIALVLGALAAREGLAALVRRARGPIAAAEDRAAIARALAELCEGQDAFDSEVTEALETLARDDDRTVRAYAAEAFGALGDERSKARIRALAEDPEPFVRSRAERVLARLAEAEAAARGPTFEDFAALAQKAQAEGGALKPWLDDLGDVRRAVREAAIVQLVKAGKKAAPHLIDRLNQPHPLPRLGAAQALGLIRDPAAAGPLVIAATARPSTPAEAELRPVALRALANCLTGSEEGLADALLPLARDQDRFVRAAALLCLGRIADRAGVREVVAALTDDDAFVVESAAIALSEGVREEDVELVLPLLDAFDVRPRKGLSALREAILIALSRIRIDDEGLRVRVRHRVRHEVSGPTAALRRAAIALLERLYSEDDPPVLPLVDAVLARLSDEHPEVRVMAASFLATHLPPGFTGAGGPLISALGKKERTLSLLGLEALARLDTPAARDAILLSTRSDDQEVAARAAELAEEGGGTTPEWTFSSPERPSPPPARVRPRPSEPGRRVRPVPAEDAVPDRSDDAPPEDRPAPEPARGAEPGEKDPTGEGEVVDAHFADDEEGSTDEGEPLAPAMSMPSGEMPAPGEDDEGPALPPPGE